MATVATVKRFYGFAAYWAGDDSSAFSFIWDIVVGAGLLASGRKDARREQPGALEEVGEQGDESTAGDGGKE